MESPAGGFLTTSSDDFFLNVTVFGIHNSKNLHSFDRSRNFNFFAIFTCVMCHMYIPPFTEHVYCLSCGCVAHRKCHNDDAVICKKIGISVLQKKTRRRNSMNSDTVVSDTIVMPHSDQEYTWEEILSALRENLTGIESESERFSVEKSLFDKMMRRLLSNPSTFPGRLHVLCSALYMLLKFETPLDQIRFARKCLDTIAAGLIFEIEKKYSISIPISQVVSSIDNSALSLFSSRMYLRVMTAVKRLPDVWERDSTMKGLSLDLSDNSIPPNASSLVLDYSPLIKFTAALDKCHFFLRILETAMKNLCLEDHEMPIGTKDSVDTDSLVQEVARLIVSSLRNSSYIMWNAECTYVYLMCNEEQWLNGKEGYALTTVMQALEFTIATQRSFTSKESTT